MTCSYDVAHLQSVLPYQLHAGGYDPQYYKGIVVTTDSAETYVYEAATYTSVDVGTALGLRTITDIFI